MKYFSVLYRLDQKRRFLIWISHERDGVVVADDGFAPVFENAGAVEAYARRKGLRLEAEEPAHDLDWVAAWVEAPETPIDCNQALAARNLFSDVARSVPAGQGAFGPLDAAFPDVYRKLFWGNNLPSVTPAGGHYDPAWSAEERASLAQVLGAGLSVFRSATRLVVTEL